MDTPRSPLVAIVNEAFASTFAGGGNPVGKRFWREAVPNAPETSYEIVGLVRNAKYQHLRQDLVPTVYLARWQDPRPSTFKGFVHPEARRRRRRGTISAP